MDGPLLKPVLEAHFEANGPHHPKILSYNKAVMETIPNIVRTDQALVVEMPSSRIKTKTRDFTPRDDEWHVFEFLAVNANKAFFTESDGTCHPLLPCEARQRSLTIQATQYASIQYSVYRNRPPPKSLRDAGALLSSVVKCVEAKKVKSAKKKTSRKSAAADADLDAEIDAMVETAADVLKRTEQEEKQQPFAPPVKTTVRAEDLRGNPDKYELVSRRTEHNIPIGNFPIMLKSVLCHLVDGGSPEEHGECQYDTGGYFIINGGERRLMYRDTPANNQPYCSTVKNNDSHMVEYRSDFPDYRSTSTNKLCMTKEAKMRPATLHIQDISIVTWLRALGVAVRGQEIFDLLCMHMQVDVHEPTVVPEAKSKQARLAAKPCDDTEESKGECQKGSAKESKVKDATKELKAVKKRRELFLRVFENTLLEGNRQLLKLQRELNWSVSPDDATKNVKESTKESKAGSAGPAGRDLARLPLDRLELQRLAIMAIGRLSKESEKSAHVLEHLGRQYVQQKLLPNMAHYWHPDTLTEAQSNSLRTTTLIWHACLNTEFSKNKSLKTDKDSLLDKRADNCDDLLSSLFRQLWRRYLTGVAERVKKTLNKGAPFSLDQVFGDDNSVGKALCDAISTGNWHADYIDNVTQATKHVNPLRKEAKQSGPRMLHPTAIRTTCPHDTPEGESCGACTFSAVLVHHSLGFDDSMLVRSLTDFCLEQQKRYGASASASALSAGVKIVLADDTATILSLSTAEGRAKYRFAAHILCNGRPLVHVYHKRSVLSAQQSGQTVLTLLRLVAKTARQWRRELQIPLDTGISIDQTTHDLQSFVELTFRTDRKRKLTPCMNLNYIDQLETLYSMVSGAGCEGDVAVVVCSLLLPSQVQRRIPLTWIDMVSSGLIEYLDKREEADVDVLIALDLAQGIGPGALLADQVSRQKYSHVEISGVVVKGLCAAATLPLAEFVAGARLTFGAAMVRQAAGAHSTTVNTERMDLSRCELEYCQAPMMRTVIYDIFGFADLPAGQNQDVLILSASDNQEDSQVHQGNVIDRGGSRTFSYRTMSVTASMIDFAGDKVRALPGHCNICSLALVALIVLVLAFAVCLCAVGNGTSQDDWVAQEEG
jgi:DNA-directed RNA polymerase beta subunit